MVGLSEERIEGIICPFESTRVDNFGLFEVTVMRRAVKLWFCLFTCLITIAVHIEVGNGLDTDACIMATTRFMARRSRPLTIISDNGTNFAGAPQEFKEYFNEWERDAVCERLAGGQIIWKMSPPGFPDYEEIWERLVRSCQKTMFAILGNKFPMLPVLTTKFLVNQTLNASPLKPVTGDREDLEALTSKNFRVGRLVLKEPLMPDWATYIDCRKM